MFLIFANLPKKITRLFSWVKVFLLELKLLKNTNRIEAFILY